MELVLERCTVRSWQTSDASRLAEIANDRRIWRNLRDRFPHPYAMADAEAFIAASIERSPQRDFCISVHDRPAGAIGLILGEDIYRRSAELGFWSGAEYWGRGIVSDAVTGFTSWAFSAFDLVRIHAAVFDWNPASSRVLEKAGFALEGRMRRGAVKDGEIVDELVFALVR
jgi:ribosomal-protein-alanine N-acetyltransferase